MPTILTEHEVILIGAVKIQQNSLLSLISQYRDNTPPFRIDTLDSSDEMDIIDRAMENSLQDEFLECEEILQNVGKVILAPRSLIGMLLDILQSMDEVANFNPKHLEEVRGLLLSTSITPLITDYLN